MSTPKHPSSRHSPLVYAAAPQLAPLARFTSRGYMWWHMIYTLRLIGRCLGDKRVSAGAKALFLGLSGTLLGLIIAPEALTDGLATLIPVVGWAFDLLGIPFEGVFDWTLLIAVLPFLIRLFPLDVQAQHIIELSSRKPVAETYYRQ